MSKSVSLTVAIAILLIILGWFAASALNNKFSLKPANIPGIQNFVPPPPPPKTTTLFFAGDIMLSRNVAGRIIAHEDYSFPFRNVADDIKKSNLAFANLESPFSQQGPYFKEGTLIFNADPKSVEGLKYSGFDILSTANNHSFDQGQKGIDYTKQLLLDNGITPIGTGTDCHDGKKFDVNGIRFGFLAYSYSAHNDGGRIPDPQVCDWSNEKQMTQDIASLDSKVDFLIVSTHMGTEYKRDPDPRNVELAHKAIDSGADMLIGHHPHWIQTIEEYNGKWIFYSLGNFVFDQMWSQDTKEGLTIFATFEDKTLKNIELRPVLIDDYCCPRWALSAEAQLILAKINLTSPYLMNKN